MKEFGDNYKMYQLPTYMLDVLQDAEAMDQGLKKPDLTSNIEQEAEGEIGEVHESD